MFIKKRNLVKNPYFINVYFRRGLIMGIWNSHTSVGNILGSLIAGAFVTTSWGWSFAVPGLITFGIGVMVFFFLVPGKMFLIKKCCHCTWSL